MRTPPVRMTRNAPGSGVYGMLEYVPRWKNLEARAATTGLRLKWSPAAYAVTNNAKNHAEGVPFAGVSRVAPNGTL